MDHAPPERLRQLRASIDNLDAAVVHLLAERFRCTQEVGVLKARHGMPPADPARETEQIARLRELAHESGLDPVFAERFLTFIIEEVVRHHAVLAESVNDGRTGPGQAGQRQARQELDRDRRGNDA